MINIVIINEVVKNNIMIYSSKAPCLHLTGRHLLIYCPGAYNASLPSLPNRLSFLLLFALPLFTLPSCVPPLVSVPKISLCPLLSCYFLYSV